MCVIFVCISSSGMFKYPQHMAWETRGEMEPTDLKLFTGELQIHHDGVTCLKGSARARRLSLCVTGSSLSLPCHYTASGSVLMGFGVSTADMKDPF